MDWSLNITVIMIGVSIVFGALLMLTLIVYVYPKLLVKKNPKVLLNDKNPMMDLIVEKNDSPDDSIDDEIAAVITAAIEAYSNSGYVPKITVRSIRKLSGAGPVWNSTGRLESLN